MSLGTLWNRARSLTPAAILLLFLWHDGAQGWDSLIDTIWTVTDSGGHIDWSHSGNNLVAFERLGADGFYDMYQMTPEGSDVVCLTDYPGLLPQRHNGQPTWHPIGNYIVFECEKDSNFDPNDRHFWPSEYSMPGKGWNCDLWCVELGDMFFTRLTNLPTRKTFFDTTRTSGALHPHFSHDGTRVLWSELVNGEADLQGRGDWGQWRLALSKFVIDENGPKLDSTVYFERGAFGDGTFYESHGFTPDDSVIIFSGNLQPGQHQTYMDIYTIHLGSHELTRLTFTTQDVWDEHSQYSPEGERIVWICSEGYSFDPDNWRNTMRTDYWLMTQNGQNARRLTYFNDPSHPEYNGDRVIVADPSWSPEGDRFMSTGAFVAGPRVLSKIVMIEFVENAVKEIDVDSLLEGFSLFQNHPNPFNEQTVIEYALPVQANMTLKIYDMLGREVRTLVDETRAAGQYSAIWDGKDNFGRSVGTGTYFCRGEAENSAAMTKMLLVR
jgi:Tol biopolymer transport system component